MTKSELIETLSKKEKLTKHRAEEIINMIFSTMTDAMIRREGIEFRGFGSFSVREYKAYSGRNPRTGECVEVAPKRLPFFKVGKALKELIDAPHDSDAAPSSKRES